MSRRLVFTRQTKQDLDNHYVIGAGVGAKTTAVRRALKRRANNSQKEGKNGQKVWGPCVGFCPRPRPPPCVLSGPSACSPPTGDPLELAKLAHDGLHLGNRSSITVCVQLDDASHAVIQELLGLGPCELPKVITKTASSAEFNANGGMILKGKRSWHIDLPTVEEVDDKLTGGAGACVDSAGNPATCTPAGLGESGSYVASLFLRTGAQNAVGRTFWMLYAGIAEGAAGPSPQCSACDQCAPSGIPCPSDGFYNPGGCPGFPCQAGNYNMMQQPWGPGFGASWLPCLTADQCHSGGSALPPLWPDGLLDSPACNNGMPVCGGANGFGNGPRQLFLPYPSTSLAQGGQSERWFPSQKQFPEPKGYPIVQLTNCTPPPPPPLTPAERAVKALEQFYNGNTSVQLPSSITVSADALVGGANAGTV